MAPGGRDCASLYPSWGILKAKTSSLDAYVSVPHLDRPIDNSPGSRDGSISAQAPYPHQPNSVPSCGGGVPIHVFRELWALLTSLLGNSAELQLIRSLR
ncbi:hypothetical protein P7K49_026674 [Saguinus oedipus]|uniref:Uncharacterized protein n=1 Tax=Saguinus oedipus TaxID=9490 RepID=A0ABQ9UF96_SAGOE|nr:hypothetical protein P7K49_026674 [Saguinus oedipus]